MKVLPNGKGRFQCPSCGLTTVELLVVTTILAVALNMLASAMISATRLAPLSRENAFAMDAARDKIEEMKNHAYNEVFFRYNADDADNPALGISPGMFFAVPGLQLIPGDADGFVGQIDFPAIAGELREDFDDRNFGMPRDLNQDGAQDALDHAGDYEILPIRVRLQWRSKSGHRRDFSVYSSVTRP